MADLLAVVDIGKTHAKLILVEGESGRVTHAAEHPCPPIPGPQTRQLDVHGIEAWLIGALREASGRERITTIVPVAHGAACVVLDAAGSVLAAPDYEDPVFARDHATYAKRRDPFSETFSPHLPLGLNVGQQLHFLQVRHPGLFARAEAILPYAQYWAWRFSGVATAEITSLGSHTDLWRPLARGFSALAERQGWAALIPPLRRAGDVLGPVTAGFAAAAGLDPACRVLCGIHDSNASYLCHLVSRPDDRPFAVVSSGTWTIVMARGVDLARLREERDMLANIDAFGAPVATARFMGGREYSAVAGEAGLAATLDGPALERVVRRGAMALPTFAAGGGPFQGSAGRLVDAEGLDAAERAALATVYSALVVDVMLDLLGVSGAVILDGPLAMNPLFPGLLAAFRPESQVLIGENRAGSVVAARLLACGLDIPVPAPRAVVGFELPDLSAYRVAWQGGLGPQAPAGVQGAEPPGLLT
ncbi:MAG TPA: hypothetical protein VME92_16295 [Acetobacteraceae bacterium]|nr:hypothetical protein [Acetobacteraceae bacterium]